MFDQYRRSFEVGFAVNRNQISFQWHFLTIFEFMILFYSRYRRQVWSCFETACAKLREKCLSGNGPTRPW